MKPEATYPERQNAISGNPFLKMWHALFGCDWFSEKVVWWRIPHNGPGPDDELTCCPCGNFVIERGR